MLRGQCLNLYFAKLCPGDGYPRQNVIGISGILRKVAKNAERTHTFLVVCVEILIDLPQKELLQEVKNQLMANTPRLTEYQNYIDEFKQVDELL